VYGKKPQRICGAKGPQSAEAAFNQCFPKYLICLCRKFRAVNQTCRHPILSSKTNQDNVLHLMDLCYKVPAERMEYMKKVGKLSDETMRKVLDGQNVSTANHMPL